VSQISVGGSTAHFTNFGFLFRDVQSFVCKRGLHSARSYRGHHFQVFVALPPSSPISLDNSSIFLELGGGVLPPAGARAPAARMKDAAAAFRDRGVSRRRGARRGGCCSWVPGTSRTALCSSSPTRLSSRSPRATCRWLQGARLPRTVQNRAAQFDGEALTTSPTFNAFTALPPTESLYDFSSLTDEALELALHP